MHSKPASSSTGTPSSSALVTFDPPGAAPMKRLRDDASSRGKLVDSTQGRRTRSIIIMDDDHVILSAINTETIAARLSPEDAEEGGA